MSAEEVACRPNPRLLLVANSGVVHVGAHLLNGAMVLGLPTKFLDVRGAASSNIWLNRFHWRLHGHRPAHLSGFSQLVVETCRSSQPEVLLATGIAPIESADLRAIRGLGIRTCNYLTDDPFNPAHRAPWFLEVLPEYDCIFSPRHANIADLRVAGCGNVVYMPFAYAPEIHFPEQPADASERSRFGSDVFFAGGADKSRIPYMAALIREGFKVALYGGYWDRYRETRASHLGFADPTTARKAAAAATVSVCLVRRANRDGHSMRSFEFPAMRACLVVEDTPDHREMFGPPGESAVYFQSADELPEAVRLLASDQADRERLAGSCQARICGARNKYSDRLTDMLAHMGVAGVSAPPIPRAARAETGRLDGSLDL